MNEEEYTNKEELTDKITLKEEELNRLKLSEQPIKQNRFDKKVTVSKADQTNEKNISKMFIGGKQQQQALQLKDGTYVNAEELKEAIQKELQKATKEDKKIIVSKKGEKVNIDDLLALLNQLSKVILSDGSSKIKSPNHHISIQLGQTKETHSKGMAFGYGQQMLPNGDYINIDDVLKALSDYMLVTKKEKSPIPEIPKPAPITPQPPPKNSQPNQNYVVKVKKKYKNKAAKWLIAMGIATTLLSGFREKEITEKQIDKTQKIITTTNIIEEKDLEYTVNRLKKAGLSEEDIHDIMHYYKETDLGDQFELKEGLELFKSSILNKETGTIQIGTDDPFKAGNYKITGFSIIHNNEMIKYIDPSNNENTKVNLADFVQKTLAENNLTIEDIQVRVHFDSETPKSLAGWCDITKLYTSNLITPKEIIDTAIKESTINGKIDNFEGDTITITTKGQKVTIPVGINGNLYSEGTKVIGSDGNEYILEKLEIIDDSKKIPKTTIETTKEEKEVVTGKKITWKIIDCNSSLLIISAILAAASQLAIDLENRKQKPIFEQLDSEEEYKRFKEDFIKSKEEYEKKSKFTRKLKEIFYKKRIDTIQILTSEQIKQIYEIIKNLNTKEYTYRHGDTISFKNGRIIVTNKNETKDITNLIIDKIKSIGDKNTIEAIGLTDKIDPEEIENGIHKR